MFEGLTAALFTCGNAEEEGDCRIFWDCNAGMYKPVRGPYLLFTPSHVFPGGEQTYREC